MLMQLPAMMLDTGPAGTGLILRPQLCEERSWKSEGSFKRIGSFTSDTNDGVCG